MTEGRDVWWHDAVGQASDVHEPEAFDAETPLFIMYTSGTTGKPKGLVHTSGGYLTQASWSFEHLFSNPDPALRDQDVHWCTADLAWVTAHTYEIYGPLSNGVTQVIFEGTPNTPHPGRHFEIIERYGVTQYYTAPTLVRSLMGWFPDGVPDSYDLSSIRMLGTVGEAVNPEAWRWLRAERRRRHRPRGGHVVAVRNRRHHPLPRPDRHGVQARLRGPPAARRQHPDRGRRRQYRAAGRPGIHRGGRPRPRHRPHRVGQPAALLRFVLAQVRRAGLVPRRRRRQVRRRRRHLDPGAGG